jgi:hypothetical protein
MVVRESFILFGMWGFEGRLRGVLLCFGLCVGLRGCHLGGLMGEAVWCFYTE